MATTIWNPYQQLKNRAYSAWLFDVDGTLTDPGYKIYPDFERLMDTFVNSYTTYFCTGSDYKKVLDQLGANLCYNAEGVFCCSGNAQYYQHELVRKQDFCLTVHEEAYLLECIEKSKYTVHTGNHIESRIGSINFSTIGRNADALQRTHYAVWDKTHQERANILQEMKHKFLRLDGAIGGEISIDFYERGNNKGQIANYVPRQFIFFGDKGTNLGNDYPLARLADRFVHVKNCNDTYNILKRFVDEGIGP
jgi:HAD superfamily hydrolase (TIGR01484 family)